MKVQVAFIIGLTAIVGSGCTGAYKSLKFSEEQASSNGSGSSFTQVPLVQPPASSPGAVVSPNTALDGAFLYAKNCAACHGTLESSNRKGRSSAQISSAIAVIPQMMPLSTLTSSEVQAIAKVLEIPVQAPNCNPNNAAFVNVQRLNNREYNNVIRDLTGLDLKPANAFPKDAAAANFDNNAAALGIDPFRAQLYFETARTILDQVFTQARTNIVTCTTQDRTCANQIIGQFASKAFRRPLTSTETNQLMAVYDASLAAFPSGTSVSGFDESLKFALQRVLISPEFLFRIIESPGNATQVRDLNSYELASRLSFLIWGSIPDSTLLQLAANNTLKANLDQQVDRMLADPKASHLVEAFGERWLNLSKLDFASPDPSLFSGFNETLRGAMKQETQLLLKDIFAGGGSLQSIIGAKYSYMNRTLASHYGVAGVSSNQFVKVNLGSDRQGILTHASTLTMNSTSQESSIVRRGLWVMTRLLCTEIGPPPPNIPPLPESPVATTNPRKLLDAHVSNPVCASCHNQIDNYSFGLESYDAIGKFRTSYRNGDPVDAHGKFEPSGIAYLDTPEYLNKLLLTDRFPLCAAQNFATYALARVLTPADQCLVQQAAAGDVRSDRTFADIVKRLVKLDQFSKQRGEN